ncbi:hypothetical protein Pan216_39130 [Planctomycetes bacterium Pan216]|uniref:Legionella pneumophila major outer membrane protein n=1 Tax=Kolteria novifilia TaxID=2527975 RepID=A0A518B7T6_9BACT|nr:hypothetical protein Pan216_39130 [Planctomycetes bacterium Pan216]
MRMRRQIGRWLGAFALFTCFASDASAQVQVPATPADAEYISTEFTDQTVHVVDSHDATLIDRCPGGRPSWFVEADYLFLKPRRLNLDYAILDQNIAINAPNGELIDLSLPANSGLRIGGGLTSGSRASRLGVFYTYLHSSAKGSVSAQPGERVIATLAHPTSTPFANFASSTASLDYDVIDLEWSRAFATIQDTLQTRLIAGGRVGIIDQRFDTLYDGQNFNRTQVSVPSRFRGGGLRLAGEGDFRPFEGAALSLFGRAGASLLVGDTKTQWNETANDGQMTVVTFEQDYDQVVPIGELAVGIAWTWKHAQVRLGYEIVNWFGLNRQPSFTDDINVGKVVEESSDLTIDGLFLRVMFQR